MAGIFASLLALFGLGGCKKEASDHLTDTPPSYHSGSPSGPMIPDGPNMAFDPSTHFINQYANVPWAEPKSGQTLLFTRETLTLKEGERTVWEGKWKVKVENSVYSAHSESGKAIGDYEYFAFIDKPDLSKGTMGYLAAYRADRASDEEFTRFDLNDLAM